MITRHGPRFPPVSLPLAVAVCVLLVAPGPLRALNPDTPVTKYTIDFWQDTEGLPNNFVKAIIQGRDGYLWLGTKGGLARFDGVRFTTYDDRKGQLAEGEVWALLEDRDGSLLVGTFGGGLSRLKDGGFATTGAKDGLGSDFVTALCQCADGSTWIGTDDAGVTRLKDGHFTNYGTKDGLLNNRVRSLYCDADNGVWVGSAGGLTLLKEGQFARYNLDLKGESRIAQIAADRDGTLWLATWADGLLHFEDGKVARYTTKDGLPSDQVLSVRFDESGTLWVGSAAGLCRRQAGAFSCYYSNTSTLARGTLQAVGIVGIVALWNDTEGNLWLGMESEGLARVKDTAFVNYGAEDGLVHTQAWTVLEAEDGSIWVGAQSGGLTQFLPDGSVRIYGRAQGLADLTVRSFHEDPDGSLWIGTAKGLFHMVGGRATPIQDAGLASASVQAVTRDGSGALWVGTNDIGLVRLHEGKATVFGAADGILGTNIRNIRPAPDGSIWFGTKNGGLHQWSDGKIRAFTTQDGLVSNAVQGVYVAKDGAVWALTRRGMTRLHEGRTRTFTLENGLPANLIYQLMEDDDGDLWLACGRGVFRIAKPQLDALVKGTAERVEAVGYGPETGLRSAAQSVSNQPSIFKGKDGRLWFASLKGISVIDPRKKRTQATTLPVRVEAILVGGRPAAAREGLELPAGTDQVEIHFTALSYFAPEKIRFRYRLQGFDADWIDAGRRRVAYYTKLPPGSYRFEVAAVTEDGVTGEASPFHFSQRPRFHETYWFYALCALAVAAVAGGIYRLRVAQLRANEKELKRRVDEEMANVRVLSGLLPICAWCRKVREDGGYWRQIEAYISERSQAQFSHGICPDCMAKFHPDVAATGTDDKTPS